VAQRPRAAAGRAIDAQAGLLLQGDQAQWNAQNQANELYNVTMSGTASGTSFNAAAMVR
jgi:hypothetical protein